MLAIFPLKSFMAQRFTQRLIAQAYVSNSPAKTMGNATRL